MQNSFANLNVSLFKGISGPHLGDKTLIQIVALIKSDPTIETLTKALRDKLEEGDKETAYNLKKSLPAVTFSGTFNGTRKAEYIVVYNQLVVLDYDKIDAETLAKIIVLINADPHTCISFISPSGNGVKIIVKVDSDVKHHKIAYKQVAEYYNNLTGLVADSSGSDVSRLCFLAHDPNVYFNEDSTGFGVETQVLHTNPRVVLSTEDDLFAKCIKITDKTAKFIEGQRNTYVYKLACECNRHGIHKDSAQKLIIANYDLGNVNEIIATVKSAYNNTSQNGVAINKLPIQHIENYLKARYDTRVNVITSKLEYRIKGGQSFENMDDYRFNSIMRDLNTLEIKCNNNTLNYILNSDFSPLFNPFTDYFNSLAPWDGKDYIQELANTVTTTDNVYWQKSLKKWLVGLVACATQPHSVNQIVLVFSGSQGVGKTAWVNRLLPAQLSTYKYDGLVNPENKDTLIQMTECLIINMDELETLTKHSSASMKSLITQQSVNIRRPYAKFAEHKYRVASFIGSVNGSQFLSDPTGTRRFSCHETEKIDYKHSIDMDKVYAQCVHLLINGFEFWLNQEEIEEANSINEKFTIETVEDQMIEKYFEPVSWKEDGAEYFTSTEILQMIQRELKFNNGFNLRNLGCLLTKKGYKKGTKDGFKKYALKFKDEKVRSQLLNLPIEGMPF